MEGKNAIYLGRIVPKHNFRAFIYSPNGQKRLVESWDEFEANMATGVWFARQEDAIPPQIIEEQPELMLQKEDKTKKVRSKKELISEPIKDVNPLNTSDVFEVTND